MGLTISPSNKLKSIRDRAIQYAVGRLFRKIYKIKNKNYVFLPHIQDYRAVVNVSDSESETE